MRTNYDVTMTSSFIASYNEPPTGPTADKIQALSIK